MRSKSDIILTCTSTCVCVSVKWKKGMIHTVYNDPNDTGTSCVATEEKLISIFLWSHQCGHATCDDTCEMDFIAVKKKNKNMKTQYLYFHLQKCYRILLSR